MDAAQRPVLRGTNRYGGRNRKSLANPSAKNTSVLVLIPNTCPVHPDLSGALELGMTSTASIFPLIQDIWQIGDASTGPLEELRLRTLSSRSSNSKLKDLNEREK